MTLAKAYGQDINGDWIPLGADEVGNLLVSMGVGFSSDPEGDPQIIVPWSYSAASGGITDTSEVTLIAAAGAGRSNYLTSMQVCNTSATATEVLIKSGWRVLWRCKVGASMTRAVDIEFQRPLISANNTSLSVVCLTTGTATYIDAQGYQDETIEQIQADITAAVELFDAAGDAIYDQSGVVITLPGSIQDSPLTSTNVTDLLAYDLLGNETDGIAIDFRDGSIVIRDTTTPANTFYGLATSKLTYTAPSTKWIRNSAGLLVSETTLRTEYDSSLNPLGMRSEPAATNLLTYSNTFSDVSWQKTASGTGVVGIVSTVAGVAPDGSATVEQITLDRGAGNTSGDQSVIAKPFTTVAASVYTAGVFLQAGTASDIGKQVAVRGAGGAAHTVITLTSAWQRVEATETALGTASVFLICSRGTITADNSVTVNLWTAQAELGRWLSSPIVTTSATVTRAKDTITMASSLFNLSATAGTLFAEFSTASPDLTGGSVWWGVTLNDGTGDNAFGLQRYNATVGGGVRLSAAFQADLRVAGVVSAGLQMHRTAIAWAANDAQACTNGTLSAADASVTLPTVTRLELSLGGALQVGGHIKRLLYVPRRMSNAELQAVTA